MIVELLDIMVRGTNNYLQYGGRQRGKNTFVGEVLQCLDDHIGMLETKLNEVIQRVNALSKMVRSK